MPLKGHRRVLPFRITTPSIVVNDPSHLSPSMTFLGKSVSREICFPRKISKLASILIRKKKRKRMFRGHFSTFITRTRVVKISIVFLIIPLVIHDAISICFIFTLFSRFTSIVREVGIPRVSMDKEVSRRRNSSQVWMSIRSPRFKIGN